VELADGLVYHTPYYGTYYIDNVPVGKTYTLVARAYSGYRPRSISSISAGQKVGFSPPDSPSSVTDIDLALSPEQYELGTISGNVTSASTGLPLAGAWVSAGFGLIAISGADGSYTLDNLPLGTYYLQAYRSGYECATTNATVTTNVTATRNLSLPPNSGAGFAWGWVRNIVNSSAINGALVSIGGRTILTQRSMDGDYPGYYYFFGLNPGSYQAVAAHSAYITATADVTVPYQGGTQRDFSLQPRGTNPVAKIVEPKPGAAVSGVVPVMGTATDDDLTSYKLECSKEATPADWELIVERTQPVVWGKLADWDVFRLSPGIYNLRLTARDQPGNQATHSIQVSVVTPGVTVSLEAPAEVLVGSNFTATVKIGHVENFDAASYYVSFNATALRLFNVTSGNISSTIIPVDMWSENVSGTVIVVQNMPGLPGIDPGTSPVTGSGYLAVLHFQAIGFSTNTSEIRLWNGRLSNTQAYNIPAEWRGTSVRITGALAGDANDDGVVNALDITKVERIIVGLDPPTPGADANQDDYIDAIDITKVERIIGGLP